MGRGLSPLQKTVLLLALKNYEEEGRWRPHALGEPPADVLQSEILEWWFQWEPDLRWMGPYGRDPGFWWRPRIRQCPGDGETVGRRNWTGQKFSKAQRGSAYNSARASLSRALTRLERRGLMTWVSGAWSLWAGADLTDEGVKLARALQENGSTARPRSARRHRAGVDSRAGAP